MWITNAIFFVNAIYFIRLLLQWSCMVIKWIHFLKTMNTQKLAKLFGWVFIVLGVLGFVPGVTTDGYLLGIFEVDPLHNILYLVSGIIALWLGKSESGAKTYFKVFGVIYALITVLGFFSGTVLGLMSVNLADNVLHLVIAAIALWFGFSGNKPSMQVSPQGGMRM